MNNEDRYFKLTDVHDLNYYQLPKVLYELPRYKVLSDSAKSCYAILKSRCDLSLNNNWVDESGHVYFIYTNDELMEKMSWSQGKLNRVKHELIEAGLLEQKRVGLNQPNRLYLKKPIYESQHVHLKNAEQLSQKVEQIIKSGEVEHGHFSKKTMLPHTNTSNQQSVKNKEIPDRQTENDAQTLDNSGPIKTAFPENAGIKGNAKNGNPIKSTTSGAQTLDNSEHIITACYIYKDLEDNKRYREDTQNLNFDLNKFTDFELQKQNKDLMDHAPEFFSDDNQYPLFLNQQAIKLLTLWCRTPKELHRLIQIILNAKKSAENKAQTHLMLGCDELQQLISNTLRRAFNAIRSNDNHVQNPENYIFGACRNALIDYAQQQSVTAQA